MSSQGSKDNCRNTSGTEERARRILEVTAELLTNWGYKRVTVEEIANRVGIGKGTVYLHWKTKEELFGVVLIKESVNVVLDVLATIEEDPQAVLLRRVVTTYFSGVMRRPLLRALCIRNEYTLGKFTRTPPSSLIDNNRAIQGMYLRYFDCLARHRLVLADCDGALVLHAANAMTRGMMMQHCVGPARSQDSNLNLMVKVLAHTVHRAFEPQERIDHAAIEGAATSVANLLRDFVAYNSKLTSVTTEGAVAPPRIRVVR